MLLHRVMGGAATIDARTVLGLGTRGGARILGYEQLGRLEAGAIADLILIDLNKIGFAGALHDPVTAPVFAGDSHIVDTTIVNGEIVVRGGKLARMREEAIVAKANEAAAEMVRTANKRTGIPFLERL
jgi:cytosine/adenosine deaminase-related metal-dependent hydrolase